MSAYVPVLLAAALFSMISLSSAVVCGDWFSACQTYMNGSALAASGVGVTAELTLDGLHAGNFTWNRNLLSSLIFLFS